MVLAERDFPRILSRKMLHAHALPGFVSEYLRLFAVASAVAIVVAVSLLVRRLPGWFRALRAASWPIAQGTVETVNVKTVSSQALGELAYSYAADGEHYSGYFLLQFANEQDAWEGVDPLKGQSIFVRYKPGSPAISAVRGGDQSFLFATRHGNLIQRIVTRHLLDLLGWDRENWIKLAARNWLVVKGRVEYGTITQHRNRETWFLLPAYTAEVSYSYSVRGEYYSGHIERSFFRETSAMKFVDSLKDKGVFVRYNQSSPSISVLRMRDQQISQPTQYHPVPGA